MITVITSFHPAVTNTFFFVRKLVNTSTTTEWKDVVSSSVTVNLWEERAKVGKQARAWHRIIAAHVITCT